jgi:peptidoglycan hydrolase CwlO-like protein
LSHRRTCIQAEYEQQTKDIGEGLAELQKYMDQIEDMQGELDERSSKTANGTGPTARARKAIVSLQEEMKGMEVKLGVTRQQLLHLNLKNHVRVG